MKKLFFTSVAVLAFSFTGNANGSVSCDVNSDCFSFALDVYRGTMMRGLGDTYATALATWAYNDCLTWDAQE